MAAVGQLANALSSHPTFPRFLGFLAVFVPVWWAWMGFTFYAKADGLQVGRDAY